MLNQPTIQLLHQLKLNGMATAFQQQQEQPALQQLPFDERLALLVEREVAVREERRLQRLLQLAKLRQQACIEDIDYQHKRGLECQVVLTLSTGQWIKRHQNLHITGPTGTGKTQPNNYSSQASR